MRVLIFCQSLLSDWNHGNAHFLRGVVTELCARGHCVEAFEPRDAWSARNLVADHGEAALRRTLEVYPALSVTRYDEATLDVAAALDGADLVLVHEWSTPALVRRLGHARERDARLRILFYDSHHRAVSAPKEMAAYDLHRFDGVLAFGAVIRDLYLRRGWTQRAWTWHEAADIRRFHPIDPRPPAEGALVWIGNWGDEERTRELDEFLIAPVRSLAIRARVHGVRYPDRGREALASAGIDYAGWLPNYEVPAVLSRFELTVHIPRRPYTHLLPGVPTIRPFEALACGIPLVTAPWEDAEGLFTPGADYLVARDGEQMRQHIRDVLHDEALARALGEHGRRTILARHTCAHRVDELERIAVELGVRTHAPALT